MRETAKPWLMQGVREYAEDMGVELTEIDARPVLKAYNEGGCNVTLVDLLDVIAWLKSNYPALLRR